MKILNYGSMNIDRFYAVEHTVRPGETILADGMTLYCGGKGLNQSIAIAKAGGEIYHAGLLGEDGDMLLDALTRYGVDTRFIRHVPGASSHTVIQVDANGQNCIIVCPGENVRVTDEAIDQTLEGFAAGDLLVLQNELDNIPSLLRKAAGLILEDSDPDGTGAIAGLSLDIPVIIGAENATRILKSGAVVTLDAARGVVSCNNCAD